MTHPIEAILFDMGGTLRDSVRNDPPIRQEYIRRIVELAGLEAGDWDARFTERDRAYFRWARETLIELDESRLWTQWMLPDQPAEKIAPLAVQLNHLWRTAIASRTIFPETREVVLELFRRGYRLGLVSNTTSSIEIPRLLKELELAGCFETVVLSCRVGMRKPDPAILLEAARRMDVEPGRCVYVGDRYLRDLPAARGAGYARIVIIPSAHRDESSPDGREPDHIIHNLRELLDLFPVCDEPGPEVVYQASLSTMWHRNNFPVLADFIRAARRQGFTGVELNHQINSSMLEGLDLERLPISSIHEPCPADTPVEDLKENDWLISSPDEECRRRGVESIRRSVEMAGRLHLPVVVVHSGMVSLDMIDEKKLRRLLEAGHQETDEYTEIKNKMREKRAGLIGPRLEAVKRSLLELLEAAGSSGVRLGLENRYHFYDIPSPDEMEELLALAGPERLGFVYDVGHAQTLHRLGFYPHEDWLRRFAPRMIETHLHDVIGVTDHLAPGLGEVDFDMLAPYLPAEALRTLELHPTNTPGQVRSGLEYLAAHGCIRSMDADK